MTTQTQDLLIEIGCEDLPARYLDDLAGALMDGVTSGLRKRSIQYQQHVRTYATPRRLAVLVAGVADRQSEQSVEQLGPALSAAVKDGQPTQAALGFARKCGVEFSALGQKDGKLHFARIVPGLPTAELIPEVFAETIKVMDESVPKRMRWGSGEETFVRPVQWLLALLGGDVVPLRRFGLESGRLTYGHRFHAPAAISLKAPADYAQALLAAKVQPDVVTRRELIRAQVQAAAVRIGGTARITEDLLAEVAALVEWPVVISGSIETRFLQLPPEVIVATVETNQRYFTVFSETPSVPGQMKSEAGYLKPAFITIANIESSDVAQVIAGNERVVRPRLTDALFFWEQDRKQPLQSNSAKLRTTTYQKDLGTIFNKVERMDGLATRIAERLQVDQSVRGDVRSAIDLCKCDLATKLVYEFPELQGLMGGYYALASSFSEDIARAIAEHYRPTQAGGPIPSSLTGQIVAVADKLDTLAGIFKIGQKPSASKDPFALRRAALGVLRIAVEGGMELDLHALLQNAWNLHQVSAAKDTSVDDAWAFLIERLRGYCLDRGATPEQFEAVRALGAAQPLDFVRRLDALSAFAGTPAAASLAAADKRARNILRQAGATVATDIATHLFEGEAEAALLRQIELCGEALMPLRAARDYAGMLTQLATLKEPVDAFFAAVMVMADDPAVRANRLALLARLDALCREVADLSLLPG